jgi:alginate biosynthesis protein Alg44
MSKNSIAVHEAEAQRQHVRVKIPAKIKIADTLFCPLRDLSVSGFAAEGVTTPFFPRQEIPAALEIAFAGFSFRSEFRCQVQYYNPKQKTLGACFTALTGEQLSLLNTIIKSYMSGIVVTQDDILKIAARDNFLRARQDKAEKKTFLQILGRSLLFLLFATAGLAVFTFAASNAYDKIFTVRTERASVAMDIVDIRAAQSGIFRSLLAPETVNVGRDQSIGVIEPAAGRTEGFIIRSPCDCLVAGREMQDGVLVLTGEDLFRLAPGNSAPFIKAMISPAQAQRLRIGGRSRVRIAGEPGIFNGTVAAIEAQGAESAITIRPESILPASLAGRPAEVVFYPE